MDNLAKLFFFYLSYRLSIYFSKTTMYHYQNSIYTIKICLHEPTSQLNTGIFPGTFCVNCKWAQWQFNNISHIFHHVLSTQVVTDLRIAYTETSSPHIHKIYIHSLRSLMDHYDYDNCGPSAFRSSQNMRHT